MKPRYRIGAVEKFSNTTVPSDHNGYKVCIYDDEKKLRAVMHVTELALVGKTQEQVLEMWNRNIFNGLRLLQAHPDA